MSKPRRSLGQRIPVKAELTSAQRHVVHTPYLVQAEILGHQATTQAAPFVHAIDFATPGSICEAANVRVDFQGN
jgi:hypothetical protein